MIFSRYTFLRNCYVVVECEWSEWQLERPCTVTCGRGKEIYTRNKTLTDNLIADGYLNCEMKGPRSENSARDCNTNCCKGDGKCYYISDFIELIQCQTAFIRILKFLQLIVTGQIGDRGRAARIDLKRNIASESKPLTDMKIAKERLVRAMKSKNDLAEVYSI